MTMSKSIVAGECYIILTATDIKRAEVLTLASGEGIKLSMTNEQFDKLSKQFVKKD